jgi:membrane-bound serine protease (ClpP class)
LIGHLGTVHSWAGPAEGKVLVDGALWRARRSSPDGEDEELHAGDEIVVERVGGLTLCVRRAEEWELMT